MLLLTELSLVLFKAEITKIICWCFKIFRCTMCLEIKRFGLVMKLSARLLRLRSLTVLVLVTVNGMILPTFTAWVNLHSGLKFHSVLSNGILRTPSFYSSHSSSSLERMNRITPYWARRRTFMALTRVSSSLLNQANFLRCQVMMALFCGATSTHQTKSKRFL